MKHHVGPARTAREWPGSAYSRTMMFDIGVGETVVLILVPLLILAVILTALYWVIRTAVRHGKQDAERDRVSRIQSTGSDGR